MKHVIGSFAKREAAEAVIRTLETRVPRERISLLTRADQIPQADDPPKTDPPLEGGLLGAVVGGAIGLAFAAGSAMLPGGTPLMAGWGPLFGILYGGMSGGVLGGLIDLGISPPSAKTLADEVEAGKILVSAEVPEHETENVKKLLHDFGADQIVMQD
ncbi:hypothetical protein [Effusibacillus pohliae]|uniref:hypothetical protein n=1 Tax=Effusibacillus pohliae TaxID=232270 RepID=UPI00036AD9F3|nr:hypothetical protein [Effusibacillus pohliae]